MAPNRGPSGKFSKGKSSDNAKRKPSGTSSSSSTRPGSRVRKAKTKRPPAKEVKSKSRSAPDQLRKVKKREYTEKELDLPTLNMITPVGVQRPKGKKKGKTFIDDQESMITILAMVNAEKEGQIESKITKARQLEEIREAKRKEAEAKQQQRKSKLENVKEELRRKQKHKDINDTSDKKNKGLETNKSVLVSKGKRKSVSFAS